jgi:hypothetical protein
VITIWLHFIGGFIVTYFLDWLLMGSIYELNNKDRLLILVIWPLVFVFVIIMIIIGLLKND